MGPDPGFSSYGATSSIVSKPPRGWLHSDKQISDEGITYAVRVSCTFGKLFGLLTEALFISNLKCVQSLLQYIGYLAVNTSMKALDFDTRSQVAK